MSIKKESISPPIIPANDLLRLEVLQRYKILYTEPEVAFDDITQLMQEAFDVDMAFISLVDENHVFFKSKIGPYDANKVEREISLCSHAILSPEPTVFEDTMGEASLADNPQVQAINGVKFYAGVPLITHDGFAIGTVCIVHRKPRKFLEREKSMLQHFAKLAMRQIEDRLTSLERVESLGQKVAESQVEIETFKSINQAYQLFLQAPVAISIYRGEDLIIELANDTALQISGKTKDVIGKKLVDIMPEVENQGYLELLKNVYKTGVPFEAFEAPATLTISNEVKLLYFNFVYQPYYNSLGKIDGILTLAVDVTEQVQARKKIEKSEQQFRNVLEQSPYPILILKGDDLILEVANQPLLDLWNITSASFGLPFLQILPEMKEQGFSDLMQNVYLEGKTHYGFEAPAYFLRKGVKELHYFNFVYNPYREKDGTITGVLILAVDVTEQVIAKQQVARSESQLRSMILQAPVGICIINKNDFKVEIANEKYALITNIDLQVLIGQNIWKVIPETNLYEEHILQVFETGTPYYGNEHAVEYLRDSQKELHYVDFVLEAIREENGEINRIMILVIDVTDKVQARQKIALTEARASLAVDMAELGTFDVDLLKDEMYSSGRLSEIFGLNNSKDRSEFVKALHPDDLEIRNKAYKIAFENGELEYEARVVHKNGSVRWVKVKGGIIFSENKVPIRLHGVALDITEQKEFSSELYKQVAERTNELTSLNDQLLKKNEELDQFAYIASHDLQEPLRKIMIFNNIIKERLSVSPEVQKYLDKCTDAGLRMTGLIKSLLDYSSLSGSKKRLEVVDLNHIFEQVAIDYELLIEQKSAVIHCDKLPSIQGIPLQLNQLIFNLIGNALKFNRLNVSPVLNIKTSLLSPGEVAQFTGLIEGISYHKISFCDNGIGFNQDYASKIFTIFQQLNQRSQFGGYGIGLALCKKIVDTHKGWIYAEGMPKEGACFHVILPEKQ